jgi:hypothetical protein
MMQVTFCVFHPVLRIVCNELISLIRSVRFLTLHSGWLCLLVLVIFVDLFSDILLNGDDIYY